MRGIATDLRQVVDLTEIKHAEREDKIISEGTEDGRQAGNIKMMLSDIMSVLKLDTLLKLSESTSHDLRAAYDKPPNERCGKPTNPYIGPCASSLSGQQRDRRAICSWRTWHARIRCGGAGHSLPSTF